MTDLVPLNHDETALEADPVQYMAVVLNRAKGWLQEAQSVEQVREAKAVAVGMESVVREKELAFDAQLAATEIVRRCEHRIGELVREGQRKGTVLRRGQTLQKLDRLRTTDLGRPHELMGVNVGSEAIKETYTMADAPADQFEQAIGEAREEGNLSRANVVRKVKGEKPKSNGRSEWHRKKRHIDSSRILRTLAQELDALTSGLDLMDPEEIETDLVAECVESITQSLSVIQATLRKLQRQL